MIDIDFLIEAIKDEQLIIRYSTWKTFIVIHENFDNKDRKMKNWEALTLAIPETKKCGSELCTLDQQVKIQDISNGDYLRLYEFVEGSKSSALKKTEQNQDILLKYFWQKISDYDRDNGVNKKL